VNLCLAIHFVIRIAKLGLSANAFNKQAMLGPLPWKEHVTLELVVEMWSDNFVVF
jgi:hypothetical protein